MAQWKEVDRFTCRGESGRLYEVVARQKVLTYSTMSEVSRLGGTIDLMTSDGMDVNELDDGRYQIVQTDEILTRS